MVGGAQTVGGGGHVSVATAPTVFISYRREDSAGHAGRLYDALAARFGEDSVFMDVALGPGIDFVERITTVVGGCRSLLVVIGPDWAAPAPAGGSSRLHDPDDFVRLEVETALAREDVFVIPLLVAGARMPGPEQLPPSLRPLARRNALELSDLRWRYDVGRLGESLDGLVAARAAEAGSAHASTARTGEGGAAAVASGAADSPGRGRREARSPASPPSTSGLVPLLAEGVVVAALAGMLGYLIADALVAMASATASDEEEIARTVGRRAITWMFVGAGLAAWLAIRRGEPRSAVRRGVVGLLLGAAAGAASGAIFSLFAIVPARAIGGAESERVDVGSLAAVGLVLGAALGTLWTPRRIAVGGFAGLVGAVLVQALLNAAGDVSPTIAVGLRCVAIAGFALTALLALDVRAATRAPPVTASPA